MEGRCVGKNCKVRFNDLPKNGRYALKNISLPQYNWVSEILKSDGIDIDTSQEGEAKICNKCYKKYLKGRSSERSSNKENAGFEVLDYDDDFTEQNESPGTQTNTLPLVTVDDLFYGSTSHRKCSVCLQYSDILTVIPKRARFQLMFHHKLWCPPDTRLCTNHVIGSDIHPNLSIDLSNRDPLKDHLLERSEQIINDLLCISHELSKKDSSPRLDFNNLTDEDCRAWTGWTLDQLRQMRFTCSAHMNHSATTENALILFWAKLKTNISFLQLSTLCGMSKKSVSRVFHTVLEAMCDIVVPEHLGAKHIARSEALNHNTAFTNCFYGNKVTVILDGTYLYIPKSTDHELQRLSFSGQKKRNLVKFMSIVFPDGYVLDTIGPFYGNENDAKITETILQKIDDLKFWLHESDIFNVDRGFRDVLGLFKSSGYEPHMPSYLQSNESQHESFSANDDRRCTKTRWVVESYHGRIKQWRFFKDQLSSNYFLPIICSLVQVITASLNWIRGPILTQTPELTARDQRLAERMQSRLSLKNSLSERVKNEPELICRRAADWKKLEAAEIDFPKLD